MENKLYIAKYSSGSYNEHKLISVFVSDDKEFVEKWVEKFNNRLAYWKDYFKQFIDKNYSWVRLDDKYLYKINSDRFYQVMECNKAFIDKIEYRKNNKKFELDFTIPEDFYTNRAKYFVLLELEKPHKKE